MKPELITDEAVLQRAVRHIAERDRVMAAVIERFGPCRMTPWANEPFSALVNSVISQQLSVKAADTIAKRCLQVAGRGQRFVPKKLLDASDDTLRGCGLSGAKVRYIKGIADAAQRKQVNFNRLRQLPDEELIKALTAFSGIGVWTAEMLMIFAFGHPDIMSLGDLGLRRGVETIYELDHAPSDRVILGAAESWRPYRSVASWYLWRAWEEKQSRSRASAKESR